MFAPQPVRQSHAITQPLVIAISGISSTGKTTVARYIGAILGSLAADQSIPIQTPKLVHQDDFYYHDNDIPVDPVTGEQNWDCPGAIDIDKLRDVISELKAGRKGFPDDFKTTQPPCPTLTDITTNNRPSESVSDEDDAVWVNALNEALLNRDQLKSQQSAIKGVTDIDAPLYDFFHSKSSGAATRSLTGISPLTVDVLKSRLLKGLKSYHARLASKTTHPTDSFSIHPIVVDGFLLFPPDLDLGTLLDIKMLMLLPLAEVERRRSTRNGYATAADALWEDPPEYVRRVVWPEYVRSHSFLFSPHAVPTSVSSERSASTSRTRSGSRSMSGRRSRNLPASAVDVDADADVDVEGVPNMARADELGIAILPKHGVRFGDSGGTPTDRPDGPAHDRYRIYSAEQTCIWVVEMIIDWLEQAQ